MWRHVFRGLAADHRLVRYDARGNGLSDWDAEDVSFEALVRDLETVIDAAGLERFALLGISQGCAVSIAYAARHPARVSRLVLLGGYAVGWRGRSAAEIELNRALLTLVKEGWGRDNAAFRQVFTTRFIPDATAEQMRWFNELQKNTTSPENAVRIQEALGAIDVSDLLPRIEVPTPGVALPRRCRRPVRIGPCSSHLDTRRPFRAARGAQPPDPRKRARLAEVSGRDTALS